MTLIEDEYMTISPVSLSITDSIANSLSLVNKASRQEAGARGRAAIEDLALSNDPLSTYTISIDLLFTIYSLLKSPSTTQIMSMI